MSLLSRPPRPARGRRVLVGLDLGQRTTPTALVVLVRVEPEWRWSAERYEWQPGEGRPELWVTYCGWFQLGVNYEPVVERVWALAGAAEAEELWVDGTGVGVAVVEMLAGHAARGGCAVQAVTMTAGEMAHGLCVPRRELFARLAVEWEMGRVRVAEGLAGWTRLREELRTIDATGRRRGGRDDAAIALALAVWGAVCGARVVEPAGRAGERPGRLF